MFAVRKARIVFRNFIEVKTHKISKRLLCSNQEIVSDQTVDEILASDSQYNELASHYFQLGKAHNCLVIQPYVKWGPQKLEISPEEQLEEAVALIKTLSLWNVNDTISVPMDSLQRKTLFKSGTMDRLRKIIHDNKDITAIFINTSNLKKITTTLLQEQFQLPILDRYKIVMQILKAHAISKHAKLQVALAELYYVERSAQKSSMFITTNRESLKLMFQDREKKLKNAIKEVRNQRALLRSKRKKEEYPIIAVVGYTNAGKTALIKALTGESSLQPKNQLFATLDVTLHSGILPSGLRVLYVDTVGFISDIPTNLIECFVATLEDVSFADVVIHVEDLSSSCFEYKRDHVLKTLKDLGKQTGNENLLEKVVSIGTKCDVIKNDTIVDHGLDILVSAKTGKGLDSLRFSLEENVLKATSRKIITLKVLNGGDEFRWLYKNATVISEAADEKDGQFIKVKVIITQSSLEKFKHYFISKKVV